ncbi:PAS domain-containing methyl-accepting chemotaxis protein [Roseibium sp. CAU 1637]|uniref:PAS domain-containing methyl-accepting chemotaxis protein n=1 Tax=Roseibium limicola TaxID=2816037 RepID=A0A939EPP1_9HYPH|nr:PAS domain-containing methyl-accepting chemotaxis protein [Roseibium limicola]MBO0345213.1 PAS domain-containing methyl-accepting chemotaxis protein [Roseibium limicola]
MSLFKRKKTSQLEDIYSALDRSQAVIEFNPDGTILTANENFLKTLGYELSEIQGHHHSMFVSESDRRSSEYQDFWASLSRGEFKAGQFKRIDKNGEEVWIEATYNPIRKSDGTPYKVVKFASDITARIEEAAEMKGQVAAINEVSAVIHFDLDGTILHANPNFLEAMGYSLNEIRGKHHSIFVDNDYSRSDEYTQFWAGLKNGKFCAGQYKRLAKGGREIWIEASYNPILKPDGTPYKVVKFATDITKQVELLKNLETIINGNFGEIEGALTSSEQQTYSAVSAADETSNNVQTIASATEELAASIREIAHTMNRSRDATTAASECTQSASNATVRLNDATRAMTGIVKLIQDIAEEINLLALNATIESARAGEAGRGFAVVANEVKNLAGQAAKATEQITQEISGIQTISGDVVAALEKINSAVETVEEQVASASAAVEEQSVVTNGMSHNMQDAANAVGTISRSVTDIKSSVLNISSAVVKTRDATSVLAR